jgi:hypothetical protein
MYIEQLILKRSNGRRKGKERAWAFFGSDQLEGSELQNRRLKVRPHNSVTSTSQSQLKK